MLNVYDLDLDPGHYRADKDPGITGRIKIQGLQGGSRIKIILTRLSTYFNDLLFQDIQNGILSVSFNIQNLLNAQNIFCYRY